MKQIYDFDRYSPPVLYENMLREELEKRRKKRQTILLAIGGVLFEIAALLMGVLTRESYPVVTLACLCHVVISSAGSGVIAVVYAQKGGNFHHE